MEKWLACVSGVNGKVAMTSFGCHWLEEVLDSHPIHLFPCMLACSLLFPRNTYGRANHLTSFLGVLSLCRGLKGREGKGILENYT